MCAVCLGRWAEPHIKNCCLAARNKCVRSSTIASDVPVTFFFENFYLIPFFLPLVVVDVFRESSLRQKTFCTFWRFDVNKNKRQSAPGVPFESTTESLHVMGCSDVRDQQNKYGLIAMCGRREKKKILDGRWKNKPRNIVRIWGFSHCFNQSETVSKNVTMYRRQHHSSWSEFTLLQQTRAHYYGMILHQIFFFFHVEKLTPIIKAMQVKHARRIPTRYASLHYWIWSLPPVKDP